MALKPELPIEQPWRVDEGVAVQSAEPRELGLFQARDGTEHLDLGAVLQLRLEADHVVQGAQRIILAELDDAIGLDQRIARIGETDRLHGAVAQRLATAFRHDFDGQAAVEIGSALPVLERDRLVAEQASTKVSYCALSSGQLM